MAREMDNKELSREYFTDRFPVAAGGDDQLQISAWEIFGSFVE
jgi:hypothetical protein